MRTHLEDVKLIKVADDSGLDAIFENSGKERHRSNRTLPPPSCLRAATLQLEKKLLTSVLLGSEDKLFSFSALHKQKTPQCTLYLNWDNNHQRERPWGGSLNFQSEEH